MKLIKRTEKLKVDLNIDLERTVLQTISISKGWGEIMEPLNQFHAQKDGTEIILSYLVIPSRLKNSPYIGGTKIVPSRLLSRPASDINIP